MKGCGMGRRGGGYTRKTTIGTDIFGRKVVTTRYFKEGGGLIFLFILWLIYMKGC
jgi:hypothetical protein